MKPHGSQYNGQQGLQRRGERRMAILADCNTKVLVQGITGREASSFTRDMLDYGTQVVAGVTPGKGGQEVHGVPVYDTVRGVLKEHSVDATIVSVPAPLAKEATLEALECGIKLLVIVTERIPRRDVVELLEVASQKNSTVVGPNSLGIISPGIIKLGMAGGPAEDLRKSYMPGSVGVASRSGGMCTEIANLLTQNGIGQSTCVSVGGDPVVGSNFLDLLPLFECDEQTEALVLFCEPGGVIEEEFAKLVAEQKVRLPVVAFVAGQFVDSMPGVRFGHAATIVEGSKGSAKGKLAALRNAGVRVAQSFSDIVPILKEFL